MAPQDPWPVQEDGSSTTQEQHHSSTTATNAGTENFIAEAFRDALVRMKAIGQKRERLRTESMAEVRSVENQYWKDSQTRLDKVVSDDPTGSIRRWARTFALAEKQCLDDALAGHTKQDELVAADREFWGVWREQLDFMCDMPPSMPPPSGSKKRKASDSAQAESSSAVKLQSKPFLKLATPAFEAADAQGHSLMSPTMQAPKPSATQQPPPSPFGAPSPISLASSPGPSILPASGVFSTPQLPASNKRRKTAAAEPQAKPSFTPISSPSPFPQTLPAQQQQAAVITTESQADSDFQGVMHLVVGEIYQAYYKDGTHEGWWMCTPLPWDDWGQEIGIDMDFTRADMWRDHPRGQYKTGKGRRKKAILGWKGRFQDGGTKVTQRVFPVLFFDDEPGSPGDLRFLSPQEIYVFPEKAMEALPIEWVAAENIRMLGTNVGQAVSGMNAAQRYRERFLARKAVREQCI
ncbi:hypothetical protein DHEL01_v209484 [Diaporthe helianthi]|uniref:Uncharacterized protein n=1 Tax=Diaporthe helianthi TaxID=158607 RepID=A0A2P5HPD5_DIAHE|nr:hypothetical protein DHEL01_v209484 [Diaporthe helianthi]